MGTRLYAKLKVTQSNHSLGFFVSNIGFVLIQIKMITIQVKIKKKVLILNL